LPYLLFNIFGCVYFEYFLFNNSALFSISYEDAFFLNQSRYNTNFLYILAQGTAHVGRNQNDIQPMQKDTYKGAKK